MMIIIIMMMMMLMTRVSVCSRHEGASVVVIKHSKNVQRWTIDVAVDDDNDDEDDDAQPQEKDKNIF